MMVPRTSMFACGSPSSAKAMAVRFVSNESKISDAVTSLFIIFIHPVDSRLPDSQRRMQVGALLLVSFFLFLLHAILFFKHLFDLRQLAVGKHGANLVARLLAHGVELRLEWLHQRVGLF